MTTQMLQQKSIFTMMAFNAAVRNFRLYPPTSNLTINSVDKACKAILSVLETEESLVFAESERKLLVCEQALGKKDRERPQVKAFEEMMLNYKIRSIAFHRGLEKEELVRLLEILKHDPDDRQRVKELFGSGDMPHITVDEKIYLAVRDGQEVLARKDDTRGRIVKETFMPMVETLDGILDVSNKNAVASQLARSIASKEDDALSMVLTQKYDNDLGARLFNHLLNMLDDDKFERIVGVIKGMVDEIVAEAGGGKAKKRTGTAGMSEEDKAAIKRSYENMLNSEKGERVKVMIRAREERERMEKERLRLRIKEGISRIFQGDATVFRDDAVMGAAPETVENLYRRKKHQEADKFMEALSGALFSPGEAERKNASKALAEIGGFLVKQDRMDSLFKLSRRMVRWLSVQKEVCPEVEKIGGQLRSLVQRMVQERKFNFCGHITLAFHDLSRPDGSREPAFAEFFEKTLAGTASPDVVDILVGEFRKNAFGKRDQAAPVLVHLGKGSVESLLDALRQSDDKFERVRIVGIVSEIGERALPALERGIVEGGPAEYVAALLVILGRIGTEKQVDAIGPYMGDRDPELRREALNAIYNIGGSLRGPLFLSALPSADDRLKIDLVAMLGAIEETDATPVLLKLLASRSLISSAARAELDEKICVALGNIGSYEAIPALESLAGAKKGLLKIRSTPSSVSEAARRAIRMIHEKDWGAAETGEKKSPLPAKPAPNVSNKEKSPERAPKREEKSSESVGRKLFRFRTGPKKPVDADRVPGKSRGLKAGYGRDKSLRAKDLEKTGEEKKDEKRADVRKVVAGTRKALENLKKGMDDFSGRAVDARKNVPERKKPPAPTMDFVTRLPGTAPSGPGKGPPDKQKPAAEIFEAVTRMPVVDLSAEKDDEKKT